MIMNILLVENNKMARPLYLFFNKISEGLYTNIYNKFQSYIQHGDVKTIGVRVSFPQ